MTNQALFFLIFLLHPHPPPFPLPLFVTSLYTFWDCCAKAFINQCITSMKELTEFQYVYIDNS